MVSDTLTTTRAKSRGEIAREQGRPRDRHVLAIMGLMVSHRWDDGSTEEYAEKTGAKPATVGHWAAEAARHLRLMGEQEAILTRAVQRLDEWADECGRDRVPALKLLLELKGLLQQRVELTGSVGLRPEMPREELARRAVGDPDDRAALVAALRAEGWTVEPPPQG